jgi:hypothetical protein
MQTSFRKSLIVSAIALGAAVIGSTAFAGNTDEKLQWRSVIGIIQGNNVVGSGTGAATGAPGPWSATGGHADFSLQSGQFSFDVRGLVLAAGNSIGTPGNVTQVKGMIICDTDGSATGGNSAFVESALVDLDDEGNARFNGRVTVPAVCGSEPDVAFLIRTASGRWIANGTILH